MSKSSFAHARIMSRFVSRLVLASLMSGSLGVCFAQTTSVPDMFTFLRGRNITGATIVTHGFQAETVGSGDSLMPLAQSIFAKTGGYFLDYDIQGGDLDHNGGDAVFDNNQSNLTNVNNSGHVVLLFDWAPESNETSMGWGEAAGDALFALSVGLGLTDPRHCDGVPLHFIAHSFGSAVTSEAVERLATYDIPVGQVTFLDPHDFDQADISRDEDQKLFQLGRPLGYGATVWDNVEFSDAYYQTRGNQGSVVSAFTNDPEGRPIPGAYNEHLDTELPAGNPYGFSSDSDHSYVWDTFYRATVDGALKTGGHPAAAAVDYTSTGWAYSQFSGSGVARPGKVFFGGTQDHEHSQAMIVDQTTGDPNAAGLAGLMLTANQVTEGGWTPLYDPQFTANGDFAAGPSVGTFVDITPGWSHHGGGGDGDAEDEFGGTNHYLELNNGDDSRIHNRLYIPANATRLAFNKRVQDVSDDDQLRVWLGNSLLGTLPLTMTDPDYVIESLAIPASLRNIVDTITFEILNTDTGIFGGVDSEVGIDLVRFGLAMPQLALGLPEGANIDFGKLLVDTSISLVDAVSLSNVGDEGSFIDLVGASITGPDADLFAIPNYADQTLDGGAAAAEFAVTFLGSPTPGMYSAVLGIATKNGEVRYDLTAMVRVPEPATLAMVLSGVLLPLIRSRSKKTVAV